MATIGIEVDNLIYQRWTQCTEGMVLCYTALIVKQWRDCLSVGNRSSGNHSNVQADAVDDAVDDAR